MEKLASEGFANVLALSGDCPTGGYNGHAAGVFDIYSVGLLKMFSYETGRTVLPRAVVNNYKRYEREVMPQYFKLARKIRDAPLSSSTRSVTTRARWTSCCNTCGCTG